MSLLNDRMISLLQATAVAALLALLVGCGPNAQAPQGMVLIPGGEFNMGSEASFAFPNEKPVHRVKVAPFFLDVHPVTNAEFAKFVEATAYKTVAERSVDWEEMKKQVPPGTPKPPDEVLQPGSLVFRQTPGPVSLRDMSQWWVWTTGASWKHPNGPVSSNKGAKIIPSFKSPGKTHRLMRNGPENACRPRRNGSSPLVAGTMDGALLGEIRKTQMERSCSTDGRVIFRIATIARTDLLVPLPRDPFRRMATVSTTWAEMSGTGVRTSTGPILSPSGLMRMPFAAIPRDHPAQWVKNPCQTTLLRRPFPVPSAA